MKGNNSSKEGNFKDTDTVQSTEWSLLCLSHQKNKLTFELVNLKTNRAHKLIFTGAGTDDLSKTSAWTEGLYAQQFKTNFPANFDNFDETLAMLSPRSGTDRNNHVLRIGWLASVQLNQPHGEGFGTWYLYGSCRVEYGSGERAHSSKFQGAPGYSGGGIPVLAYSRAD